MKLFVFTHTRPDADAFGSAIAAAIDHCGTAWFSEESWASRPATIRALCEKYAEVVEVRVQVGGEVPKATALIVTDCGDPGRVSLPPGWTTEDLAQASSYDHHLNAPVGRPDRQFGSQDAASASWVVATEMRPSNPAALAFLWAGHVGDTGGFTVGNVAKAIEQAGDLLAVDPADVALINAAFHSISAGRAKLLGKFWTSLAVYGKVASTVLSADAFTGGITRADYAGMPSELVRLGGVDLGVAITEDAQQAGLWRIAFRSSGTGLAKRLAQAFDGNGHPDAAGGQYVDADAAPCEVRNAILQKVEALLEA